MGQLVPLYFKSTDRATKDAAIVDVSNDAANSAADFLDAAAADNKKDAAAVSAAADQQPERAVSAEEYAEAKAADEALADTIEMRPTTLEVGLAAVWHFSLTSFCEVKTQIYDRVWSM
jgi:hypothetical protein